MAPYAELFAREFEKSASADEIPEGRFAIDTQIGGQAYRLLPLNDDIDVTSSAFDLAKMASEKRIHFLMLVPAAREIVKAAAEFNVDHRLPEIVTRFGTPRLPDADTAAKLIEGRENYCKEAGMKDIVAEDYRDALATIVEDPEKAMETISAIDRVAGIEPNLRKAAHLPTPYDIVYCGPLEEEVEKAAKENVYVRDVLVPLSEVRRINPLDVDFRLSKSAAEEFHKIHDTDDARDLSLALDTWEEKDQRTFLRLAAEAAS